MIVEDPEGFKAWMTKILEPMCDADPEALAKYVYALVKKDKPLNDLVETMYSQLEVFLQKDTKPFVDLLFKKLENQGQTNNVTPVKVKEEPTQEISNSVEREATPPPILPVSPTSVIQNPQVSVNTAVVAPLEIPKEEKEPAPNSSLPPPSSTTADRDLRLSTVQIIKEQINAVSSGQRNGTLGAALLSAASRRDSVSERRSSLSRSHDRKSDSEREDRGGSSGRSRSLRRRESSSSPVRRSERSRSRSWERSSSRRSRSRERERDRSRAWRNKSPPPRRYDRDRRRSYTKSPVRRSRTRSRSRSPLARTRSSRYRNRSPPLRSRSRSRSLSLTDRRSRSPLSGGGTPTQDSNHGDTDMRLSTTSQSIQSVVSVKDGLSTKRRCQDYDEKGYCMKGELCPYDHGSDPVVLEDVSLPQVLAFPSSNNQPIPPPPPPGIDAAPRLPLTSAPPVLPAVRMPGMQSMHHRPQGMIRPTHSHPGGNMEYNPDAPSMEPRMWGRQQYFSRPAGGRPMLRGARAGLQRGLPAMRGSLQYMTPPPVVQRELISVPVHEVDYNQSNPLKRQLPADFNEENCAPLKQQQFDFSRLGPRRQPLHKSNMIGGNCSLQLKKVPIELNNIAHLNNHFAKFGKIVNIQVSFEGDPEAALITFSNHAEANLAYRSTEAVLNNRFIKVRWHFNEKDGKQENVPPARVPAKERLGAPVVAQQSLNTVNDTPRELEKVVLSGSNLTKTVYIPTALKKPELQVAENSKPTSATTLNQTLKKRQEIEVAKDIIKKKREEKQKEAIKMSQQIMKKNQDLIEKLLSQQKLLIDRVEKGNLVPEARNNTLQAIQTLQENIDLIRKEIEQMVDKRKSMNIAKALKVSPQLVKQKRDEEKRSNCPVALTHPPTNLNMNFQSCTDPVETQRQILDAELDIFNRQQEGKDTADLQKHVLELKTKAQSLGLLTGNSPLTRGRGRPFRGRGRGIFVHSSVDHRPTRVLVSGFETDDKAEVLAHFAKFGEIIDYVWDETTPALELNFKTRKEAETAMKTGRNFQDRLLSVTWYNTGQGLNMRNNMMRPMLVMTNEGVGNLLDEQEEEEDELGLNLGVSEDFLLQDEEEEEDEVRSWRR